MTTSLLTTVAALAAWLGVIACQPAAADIKASSEVRYYALSGTTAESLRNAIAANPLHGPSSDAAARTDATFDLSLKVSDHGACCEATDAIVTARFVTTLPRAPEAAMTPATRGKWREFLDFARRHEAAHKAIYLQCMSDFIRTARLMKSRAGCEGLTAVAVRQFDVAMKVCGARHDTLDASDGRRVQRLSIFRPGP